MLLKYETKALLMVCKGLIYYFKYFFITYFRLYKRKGIRWTGKYTLALDLIILGKLILFRM